MKSITRQLALAVTVALLAGVWLAGCARQQAPSVTTTKAPAMSAAMSRTAETAAIRQALHRYVEEHGRAVAPEGNVDLAQVSIDSDYALVTWAHERRGGQAVLQKQQGAWQVLECGPGWLGLKGMSRQDVPVEVAKKLLDGIDPNWPSYETF
jgi:hypothetical protein